MKKIKTNFHYKKMDIWEDLILIHASVSNHNVYVCKRLKHLITFWYFSVIFGNNMRISKEFSVYFFCSIL